MDSSNFTIRQCCGIFKLFYEDSHEVRRVHCVPRSNHMLSVQPMSVSRMYNLRKVRSKVCTVNSRSAGWLYTHALLHDLLGEYNIDRKKLN